MNAVSAATPAIAINTVNTCTSTTRARKSNDNNAVTCISAAGLSSRATTKSNVSITEATTSALSSSAKTLSSVVDPPSKKKEKQGTTIHPIVFNNCFVTTSELDLEDTEIQARIDSLHPAPSGALDTPYAAHQHSVSLNNLQIPGKTTAGSKPLPLKDNNNRRKSDLPGLSKTPFTLLSDSSRHPVENAHGQKLAVLTPSISIIGGVDGGDGSCNDATASEEGLSLQKHRFMPFELSPPKNHGK